MYASAWDENRKVPLDRAAGQPSARAERAALSAERAVPLPFKAGTSTFHHNVADLLITGATGFVGSHLVEALARRGTRVRALARATSDTSLLERFGVERVTGALDDAAALRRAVGDVGTVVHLAAATRSLAQAGFHRVNVDGTLRLLEAMEADGARRRLVFLSSMAAAGPSHGHPVAPGDEPRPLTAYGRSKLEGERHALSRQGVTGIVLRPPAVYGPRDRDLLTFFRLADRGLLPLIGPAERRLQMVYAADLAEALVLATERAAVTGVYHIAEPVAYTWTEVLDRVAAAVGRGQGGIRVRVPAAALHVAAAVTQAVARVRREPAILDRDKALEVLADGWTCDTESARRDLGFVAGTPLVDGLRETAGWYRAHGWL
jgi:nucleoside-diphosphate-sugar epimerase